MEQTNKGSGGRSGQGSISCIKKEPRTRYQRSPKISSDLSDLAKRQANIKPPVPEEDDHRVSAVSATIKINAILKKRWGRT